MSHELNTQTRTGLFAGKARTVAAVAAFSGLALATTVSVQATQNASDQAPAAESTVSAEPAAKADSAPAAKAKDKVEPKAEQTERNASSVFEAAPVSHTAELDAPAAAGQEAPVAEAPVASTVSRQAPAPAAAPAPKAEAPAVAPQVTTASENVTPLPAAEAPAAPAPAAAPAPEAEAPAVAPKAEAPAVAPQVTTASENVTPLPAAEAPAAQGRHAAAATAETQVKEAEAARESAPATTAVPASDVTPVAEAAPAPKAPATPNVQTASTKTQTQSSNVPASQSGQAILGAAEAQLGATQDCTMLVTNSLKAVGIDHHGWPDSYKSLGTSVSSADAQAGDLAYYADGGAGLAHIAVYAGNGQAIHGGWNGNQTVKTTVNVGSGPEFIRVN